MDDTGKGDDMERGARIYRGLVDSYNSREEALKRDPGDARVNTALGIRRLKQARYAEAEEFLRGLDLGQLVQ